MARIFTKTRDYSLCRFAFDPRLAAQTFRRRPVRIVTSRFTRIAGFLLLCAVLSGCVAPSYRVGVSGFSDSIYFPSRSYWLLPGKEGVTSDDIEFREYTSYLKRGLTEAGFVEAENLDQADFALFVSYGIGNTKERQYSYSLPVYGQIGGGTFNFSGTTYSGYGSTTTYGTIHQQPQYGIIGSQQISDTDVTHLRYLLVDAVDLKAFRKGKKATVAWRTDVLSRGTNADLRHVFPVLVAAAAPYFGKNTKEQIVIQISERDKKLQMIRNEVVR